MEYWDCDAILSEITNVPCKLRCDMFDMAEFDPSASENQTVVSCRIVQILHDWVSLYRKDCIGCNSLCFDSFEYIATKRFESESASLAGPMVRQCEICYYGASSDLQTPITG